MTVRSRFARSWLNTLVGGACLLAGLILLPLPVPLGLPLLLIGAGFVVTTSKAARALLRSQRAKNARLDDTLAAIAPRLPRMFKSSLNRTRPRRWPRRGTDPANVPAGPRGNPRSESSS